MKALRVLLAILAASAWAQQPRRPASSTEAMYQASAASCERKIRHIEENAKRPQPDQTPTVLLEREINAYLAAGKVKLPQGVKKLRLEAVPNIITGVAWVDFDEITAGKRSANPLLRLFRGRHDVRVIARASGSGGQGMVHIESVSIDDVGVPRMALEFFIDRYVRPKHPEVGLDSRFPLPARIDLAIVGDHKLTVTQK